MIRRTDLISTNTITAEQFIQSWPDESVAGQLWRAIKGKGAFRYFKDTLHRLGIEKRWYEYRDKAMKDFIISWAEDNGVAYVDDTRGEDK